MNLTVICIPIPLFKDYWFWYLGPLHRCILLLSGAVVVRYWSWKKWLDFFFFFFKCTRYLCWAGYRKPFHLDDFLYSRSFPSGSSMCCYCKRKFIECKECSNLHIKIFKNISWFLKYVDLNFKQNLKAV